MNQPTEPIICPLCMSDGWPSALHIQAYAAVCGTAWGAGIEPRQSEPCHIIAQLRIDNALMRMVAA